MVEYRRGDIVLCDLNPVVGTEQAGVRTVLVVQTDEANAVSPHTLIAPFTTKIRAALLPSHVLISAQTSGLDHDSVLLCEHLRVVDRQRIRRVLSSLDDATINQVALALIAILDI